MYSEIEEVLLCAYSVTQMVKASRSDLRKEIIPISPSFTNPAHNFAWRPRAKVRGSSKFLSEHSSLRPADWVQRWEAVVLDDAEVAARGLGDLARRVGFEAEHDFEHLANGRRPH